MEDFKSVLAAEFAPFGILSDSQLNLLQMHYDLVLRWNRRINLTRITSLVESVQFHYCESLYLARFLPKSPLKIVDVGSGAGFPGIPVAVYRPECSIDLVESHQRKAVFLTEVVRRLELPNVRVLATRAEDLAGHYDWMVSRAVSAEQILKLKLAPNAAVLGNVGDRLPWGEARALFHLKRSA
jgi:16S rRNA (guanine527-N7)-methyltransferase